MTYQKFFRILSVLIAIALIFTQTAAAADTPQVQMKDTALPRSEERGMVPQALPDDGSLSPSLPQTDAGLLTFPSYQMVVFQSLVYENGNYNYELFSASNHGNTLNRLTYTGASDALPRLNRDSTRVVFDSNRSGNYEIFTMNADGSAVWQITANGSDDYRPAWSPDGTKIAFQSLRDGQSEIYVMNSDGSGLTRLTYAGSYDGLPTWSPDGSRIAFVSDRAGKDLYYIYVMAADGTGPIQLSTQLWSENPVWSPDGARIAYDADGNGDGWQELWVMNADSSGQHQVYYPGSQNDAYAGSWSPDSQFVAMTLVNYVYMDGNWYWTHAYPYSLTPENPYGTISGLFSSNGMDWNPDWKSTDCTPPVSRMVALPLQSPAHFTVYWSGSDGGISGLQNYDVQYKLGTSETWLDWMMQTTQTSASFVGTQGGAVYYFRVRGRDNAGNEEVWRAYDAVTTIESLAPYTWINPLPDHLNSQTSNFLVSWDGVDLGGSGIWYYQLQYRDLPSGWVDWMSPTEKEANFTFGQLGHTYCFRVRGSDNANNLESWHAGPENHCTTLYSWAVGGVMQDNRDVPVMGAGAAVTPSGFEQDLSDETGAYTTYASVDSPNYQVTWSKSGYADLPATSIAKGAVMPQDAALPPADNIVLNWGFEQGSLSSWSASGDILPVRSDTYHSGAHAARLGNTSLAAAPDAGSSSTLSQDVVIAVGMNAPTLSFMYQMSGASGAGGPQFSASVILGGVTTPLLVTGDNTVGWHHVWYDLSLWAGESITLSFKMQEVEGQAHAAVLIDEVTVGAAHSDVWVKLSGPAKAVPGSQVVFQLTYGNRGAVAATDVVITELLAEGMTFVSASVAPSTTSPLAWEVGDLAAGSGPNAILITVLIGSSTPLFNTLTNSADIVVGLPELELLNNEAQAVIWVGANIYLPQVSR